MIEPELKACPFCGGDAQFVATRHIRVACQKCHAGTLAYLEQGELSMQAAADLWNARAGCKQPKAAPNAGDIAGSISANGSAAFEAACKAMAEYLVAAGWEHRDWSESPDMCFMWTDPITGIPHRTDFAFIVASERYLNWKLMPQNDKSSHAGAVTHK